MAKYFTEFDICSSSIILLVCPPPPPLNFALLLFPREIKDNVYAFLGGGGGGGGQGVLWEMCKWKMGHSEVALMTGSLKFQTILWDCCRGVTQCPVSKSEIHDNTKHNKNTIPFLG